MPGLLYLLLIPNFVWQEVTVDRKDILKDCYGYDYIWAFVCCFSKILVTLLGRKTDIAADLI